MELKRSKTLQLDRETVRGLTPTEMTSIVGGGVMVSATIYLPAYSEICRTKGCDYTDICNTYTGCHGHPTR